MRRTPRLLLFWGAVAGLLELTLPATAYAQCEATESSKCTAGSAAVGDWFGYAAAVAGNVSIIGAPTAGDSSGAVFVFQFDGSSWSQSAQLVVADGDGGDWCGGAVAAHGDIAVAGAPYDENDGATFSGSAYVFRFDGAQWNEEQKLVAPVMTPLSFFGWSVATDGNTIAVGAYGTNGTGAVLLFQHDGNAWVLADEPIPDDLAFGDEFGTAVDVEADVLVVGAPRNDDDGQDSGAAYVFRRNGAKWTQESKLTASNASSQAMFGSSISLSGNAVLVAANNSDPGFDDGSAYVFRHDGVTWIEEHVFGAPAEAPAESEFAISVAIDGNKAVVGTMRDDGVSGSTGSAYLFSFDGTTWLQQAKLIASDGASDDLLGFSVSIDGDTALIGAYGADPGGAAYVFDGLADGVPDLCENDCPWDLDGGGVGITDFLMLLSMWGSDPGGPPDFNGDGNVGIQDFLEMLSHWGECP